MIKKIKEFIKELRRPYYTNKKKRYKNFSIGNYTYGSPKIYANPENFIQFFLKSMSKAN